MAFKYLAMESSWSGFCPVGIHDSVNASGLGFHQRDELDQMPVQVDPLDSLQSRVMQKARQMVPHRPGAGGLSGQCKCGVFVEQIQILRAEPAGTVKDLHGPANDTGTAEEMNQRLAIEVDVKKSAPICEQLHRPGL